MNFSFEFTSPIIVRVEESVPDADGRRVAIIEGTLLREGVSANSNLYTVEELEAIAMQGNDADIPIYYGTTIKIDPNDGRLKKGMHANMDDNQVGSLMQTIFDSANRAIHFFAKVWDTPKFPDLISRIKSGWGVSIGGMAHNAKLVLTDAGQILTKIAGMDLSHVQLIDPSARRGMASAQVEKITIEETFPEAMNLICDPEHGVCFRSCAKCKSKLVEETRPIIQLHINV